MLPTCSKCNKLKRSYFGLVDVEDGTVEEEAPKCFDSAEEAYCHDQSQYLAGYQPLLEKVSSRK